MVPACNFYHFLVPFASPASPEDIHKELSGEREIKTIESDVKGERERQKRLKNTRRKRGKGNMLSSGKPYD